MNNDNEKINVTFNIQSGFRITIIFEEECTVEGLIKIFFEKMNYNFKNIDERIIFMHNNKKLKYNDKTKLKSIFITNNEYITVYDKNYSLLNNIIILRTLKGEEYKISSNNFDTIHSLLKIYFDNIGKTEEPNKYEGLKDILFEDFLVKLSNIKK